MLNFSRPRNAFLANAKKYVCLLFPNNPQESAERQRHECETCFLLAHKSCQALEIYIAASFCLQISSKEAKASKQALMEIASPPEPVASKKNLFEAGDAWNQNATKTTPSKVCTTQLKVLTVSTELYFLNFHCWLSFPATHQHLCCWGWSTRTPLNSDTYNTVCYRSQRFHNMFSHFTIFTITIPYFLHHSIYNLFVYAGGTYMSTCKSLNGNTFNLQLAWNHTAWQHLEIFIL